MPARRSTKSLRRPPILRNLTAAPVLHWARLATLPALLVLVVALPGCSSAPKPDRLFPQTMSSTPPPEAESLPGPDPRETDFSMPAEPVTAAEPGAESGFENSKLTVVIENETIRQSRKQTLVEAAAAERKRRQTSGRSIAVVTNKNLADFTEGRLTEMGEAQPPSTSTATAPAAESAGQKASAPGKADATGSPSAKPGDSASAAIADPETFWRGRILRARMNWASAVEETEHLKGRIAELRQRFYAEEDPYYRDSQIKPSWDRALDRLEETRAAIDQYRSEVRIVLEEGRRASALPGWLREGIDLEPDVVTRRPRNGPRPPGEHVPGEPQIAADPDGERR